MGTELDVGPILLTRPNYSHCLTLILVKGSSRSTRTPDHFRHQNSGTANTLSLLCLNMFGLQDAMLIGGTPRYKNPTWPYKPEVCRPFVVICGSHHISSSRAHGNKIPKAIPMFSRSSCSMVLSTMSPEVELYRK